MIDGYACLGCGVCPGTEGEHFFFFSHLQAQAAWLLGVWLALMCLGEGYVGYCTFTDSLRMELQE